MRRRLRRREERDVVLVALVGEVLRDLLAVGDDDRDELGREQAVDRALQLVLRQAAQVGDLRRAQDLDAERMDEVHVPDLADGRLQRGLAGQHAVAALAAAEPVQAQPLAVVVEEALDADLAHAADLAAHACRLPGCAKQCDATRPARRRGGEPVAKRALGEHLRELRQELQVQVGGLLGHQQHEHLRRPACRPARRTGSASAGARTRRAPRLSP